MNRNQVTLLLWQLCLFILVFGHNTYAGVDSSLYLVKNFTNENGLPQNSVNAIIADEYGFIWMATEAGIVRFDGRNFKLFNKKNTNMNRSRISTIQQSPSGAFYAISEDWSLIGIGKGKISGIKSAIDTFKSLPPECYIQWTWNYTDWPSYGEYDSLWLPLNKQTSVILTKKKSLLWYQNRKMIAALPFDTLRHFRSVFTLQGSLFYFPQIHNSRRLQELTPQGNHEVLWKGDILQEPANAHYVLCSSNSNKMVFLYTNNNLYLLEKQSDGSIHTSRILSGFDLAKKGICSGYYDRKHKRLFLGSSYNGLYIFEPKYFQAKTYLGKDGSNNMFYEQLAYSDSTILTGKGILFSPERPATRVPFPSKNVIYNYGATFFKAKDGIIWIGDISKLSKHSKDLRKQLKEWNLPQAFTICENPEGILWIAAKGNGIFRLNTRDDSDPELIYPTKDYILCMYPDENNCIWVGSEQRLIKLHTQSLSIDTIQGLNRKVIRSLYISGRDEVWVCTYEDGFFLYKNNKLTRFPTDKKGYLGTVHRILEDSKGYFWITTNNGLFQVSKQDLLAYAADKKKIPFYYYYNKSAGFNTNEFNGGSQQVGLKLPNGYFSFSSMDGIVFFRPQVVNPDLPDAPLLIDKIEVNEKGYRSKDSITVARPFSTLRFRIATAYFGNPDNLVFEYRLDDNEKWNTVENETFAFNSLPAGHHQVSVRKRTGFGNHYNYATINVFVPPVFYEKWWFIAGLILLVGCLVGLFVRLRMMYLKRQNRMLEFTVAKRTSELENFIGVLEVSEAKLAEELRVQKKLIGNIAHDIKTPLNFLTISAKHLLKKVSEGKVPDYDEAESIYASSGRIYNLTDNLTNYLMARLESGNRKQEVNLYQLIERKGEMFDIALKGQRSKLINKIDKEQIVYAHAQLLDMVLHNLIDNAIKHTSDGMIICAAAQTGNIVSVTIEDQGTGLDERKLKKYNSFFNLDEDTEIYKGLGFLIIKDILPMISATLLFKPSPIKGLTAQVTIRQDDQLF